MPDNLPDNPFREEDAMRDAIRDEVIFGFGVNIGGLANDQNNALQAVQVNQMAQPPWVFEPDRVWHRADAPVMKFHVEELQDDEWIPDERIPKFDGWELVNPKIIGQKGDVLIEVSNAIAYIEGKRYRNGHPMGCWNHPDRGDIKNLETIRISKRTPYGVHGDSMLRTYAIYRKIKGYVRKLPMNPIFSQPVPLP